MAIDILLPNGIQIQQLVDVTDNTLDMTSAPVIQTQTITSTKAAVPASAKSGRRVMVITNLDDVRTVRIGPTSITEKIGYLLEPRHSVKIPLDPSNAQAVYAIATGAELKVEVIEQ